VLFCLHPTTASDADAKDRDWNPGDWKYQEFGHSRLELDGLSEPAILELACRALVRLESANGFAPLRRTADFTTLVVDHEEGLDSAWRRMNKVKAASSRTASRPRGGGSRRAAGRRTSP